MATLAGFLGLAVGSFLNVVIYRVPMKQSIIAPPSACPRCLCRIRSYDKIPIISWLLLHGKCRECKGAISVRYPLVELSTGIFFGVVAWKFLPVGGYSNVLLFAFLYFAAISVVLALIDMDTHTLPNSIVLPSYLVGVLLLGIAAVTSGENWAIARSLIGAATLWLLYLTMALAYPAGMGLGDVKFAGVLGLFLGYLGWGTLVIGAFAAFVLGGLYAIALVISQRSSMKSGIPFGPWMLVGAWVGVFFSAPIVEGYFSFFISSSHI